jgi:hypothetical protein
MWRGSGSSEREPGFGTHRRTDDLGAQLASASAPLRTDFSQSPVFASSSVDTSHAGALCTDCEGLFRSTERAAEWAWRLLRLTKGGSGAGALVNVARTCALDFLDRVPPLVRRGVTELLGYSTLWQAVCTRLGRPAARPHEELLRELGADLQLLLRNAQSRLGTAAALEQGLLVHVGRLRESRGTEPGAPLALRAALEGFTHAVSEVLRAASAYRRAWESAEGELSEWSAWLSAEDPGFCAWLAEHLSDTVFAWRQTHAAVRLLRELGALAGQS